MELRRIERGIEPVLAQAVCEFPVVVLAGPRQAGKSTLLQHLFGRNYRYISLDRPAARASVAEMVRKHTSPLVLDEIEHAPDLLGDIEERAKAGGCRSGQFLLACSRSSPRLEQVMETLAGKAALFHLFPLSRREITGAPQAPLPWESEATRPVRRETLHLKDAWQGFFRGGHPDLAAHHPYKPEVWHSDYLRAYLEDMKALGQVNDVTLFRIFMEMLAAKSGGLLNLTELARNLDVAVNTVRAWLKMLEVSYLMVVLWPYSAEAGRRRLVKTPKVFFTDTGMLCFLLGVKDYRAAMDGPMREAIFKTAVFLEIFKALVHRGLPAPCLRPPEVDRQAPTSRQAGKEPRLWFWRTSTGAEVDFVIEVGNKVIPVNARAALTPEPEMAAGIRVFQDAYADKTANGYVVTLGQTYVPLAPDVKALPFSVL